MGSSSFLQEAFIGGEISQSAQGRVSHPLYRASLNIARNMIPVETGALHRRPGTRHCGITRNGSSAKIVPFDFQDVTPYQMEFTSASLRFWNDGRLVTHNDTQVVTAISAANPAVVTTAHAHGWSSFQRVIFNVSVPLLQNRVFQITVTSATQFSLIDALSGATIDGSTLGALAAGGTVSHVVEIPTNYIASSWSNLRSVQAETTAVLLNGTQPLILTVETLPTASTFAEFALNPSDFLDGPYLTPIKGSYITSSGVSGVVTLTLSFQPYDAAVAYDVGDYVTWIGQGYRSITAANQGHRPDFFPGNWLAVNAGDPINDGAGFTTADIGRLVRIFSEPPLWDVAATYVLGQIIAYADADGAVGYWQATGAIGAGVLPGTSTLWSVVSGSSIARWTWARVLSVSGAGLQAPVANIGDMTAGGGLAAAFDGVTSKAFAASADVTASTTTYPAWQATGSGFPFGTIVQYNGNLYLLNAQDFFPGTPPPFNGSWLPAGSVSSLSFDNYVGQHFGAPTQIFFAIVYPSIDVGFANSPANTQVVNLRAKSTAPANAADGTLLGSTGVFNNRTTSATIVSNDPVTAWNYVWVEVVASFTQPLPDDGSHVFTARASFAQVQFYAPNIANGSVITAQIVGDPLLYANASRKWRLGVYGGAAGWPKNGTYHEGRLWLSGVVGNRVDSSKSNDIFNFAPTAPSGVVADDNAISAVFDAPDVNAVLWMTPDEQGIICGTQAREWLVQPASPGVMSPSNIAARPRTKIGCADTEPRRTDHTLVLVQKFQREIMEYFADVYSGKFSAPSINERAKHLTVGGIEEIAYQQELASIVWARRHDGNLLGTTYKRDSLTTSQGPNIAGAHQHVHGGGRFIISISVGGSQDGTLDALYTVTRGSDGIHHVEVLTKLLDEGFALTDVWQVDDGIAPASFSINATPVAGAPYGGVTINGLWAHNGKTVQAWLAGLDCGVTTNANAQPTITDFLVSNGSIFVPFGDGFGNGTAGGLFTQALVQSYATAGLPLPGCIGFTFTSDAQIVRPATAPESGTRAGPAFAKLRRGQQFGMQIYGAINGSIQIGMDFDTMLPIDLRKRDGETAYTALELFNGITRAPVEASNDFDNMLCWRITRPVPAWFIAVGEFLHTQDI